MKNKFLSAILIAILTSLTFLKCNIKNESESMNEDKTYQYTNHLVDEKSPYLLQHAHNPVDWYPWGEEAFEKAKKEDKPVFLSIGYSTCHWCHVMERESFEDPGIAEMMNEAFVNIKVDREERPDIDAIYMNVCQMLTGSGGWPLTVFLTPEKKPFFAGTYFPKESMYGRIGMKDLIPRVKDLWETQREKIDSSAEEITNRLQNVRLEADESKLEERSLDKCYREIDSSYDTVHGGFGSPPKFPTPHKFLFLLRYWKRSGDENALKMVEHTLREMRMGGVYDHVGFGFHRYSTNQRWLVPHFEKMLYDQALMTYAFVEAFQATGDEFYKKPANEILEYVMRDMTSPDGGFYSAEDADSEGEEGKFYVWQKPEIERILEDDGDIFIDAFNVTGEGNFKEPGEELPGGKNILNRTEPLANLAEKQGLSKDELAGKIEQMRRKLFEVREDRVHPHKDDKILTDWNGLMIAAFAKAGAVFGNEEFIKTAENAAKFVLDKLALENGRLLHRFRGGEAAITGMLDDYAFLVWGLLELYEASFDIACLQKAIELTDEQIDQFADENDGGFYISADSSEKLITRSKEFFDGAIPSGNSVSMMNLIKLRQITAGEKYTAYINKSAGAFARSMSIAPSAFTFFASAADFMFGPSYEIVITGDPSDAETREMLDAVREKFLPNSVILFRDAGSPEKLAEIAEFTKMQEQVDGKSTAYVCRNYACEQPVTSVKELINLF